jgi:hypothetical protein
VQLLTQCRRVLLKPHCSILGSIHTSLLHLPQTLARRCSFLSSPLLAGGDACAQSYRGQSNQGDFDGYGHYTYSDGSEYEGSWSDGVRSGTGAFVWPNGEKYTGAWSDHKRNGRGKYEWPDGRSFEGDYVSDLRTGHGLMEWPDGTRYEVCIPTKWRCGPP